jgi:ATP-dependent protease ClpP protease subunit
MFMPRPIGGDIGAYRSGNTVFVNLLSAFTNSAAAQIAMDLIKDTTEEDTIELTLMTPGGDSNVLNQIGAMLDNSKAKKKVFIAGIAASCGGFVIVHADEIYVDPLAIIMFHNASVSVVGAHVTRAATYLKCMEVVVSIYTDRLVEKGLMTEDERANIKTRNIDIVLLGQDLIDRGIAKPIEEVSTHE